MTKINTLLNFSNSLGTNSRRLSSPNNELLFRMSGNYLALGSDEPAFNHSDIFSIALLNVRMASDAGVAKYYQNAYKAVCAGLQVKDPAVIMDVLQGVSNHEYALQLGHFLRVRHLLIIPQDEWGSFLEGDLWGTRTFQAELRDTSVELQKWYHTKMDELLDGISKLDHLICKLLNWDTEKQVSYHDLKTKYNYPEAPDLEI